MQATLSELHIYPLKSTAGISISRSAINEYGLAFDRQFVLSDSRGKFITARTKPALLKIAVALTPTGLILTAPEMQPLEIRYAEFSANYCRVTIWGDEVSAQHCGRSYDHWFSEYLQQDCQLLFFGEQSQRLTAIADKPVAFADGFPLLLISQASLDDLNNRCQNTITAANMRPNIVISGTEAYAEDHWKRIRIGSVEFAVVKPCGRCILTTVDPETSERNALREPLSTLKQYRIGRDGEAHFGQNLIPLNSGVIELSDVMEVLETQTAEGYQDLSN
ncbi:MOSC domain-containing protein [Amphritea sp. HPY]|uniref:MOSC domain-containing protein n=1 Tax=Amphritea sp. HPY TaxID=3421652 RepID=UPI003D7D5929